MINQNTWTIGNPKAKDRSAAPRAMDNQPEQENLERENPMMQDRALSPIAPYFSRVNSMYSPYNGSILTDLFSTNLNMQNIWPHYESHIAARYFDYEAGFDARDETDEDDNNSHADTSESSSDYPTDSD